MPVRPRTASDVVVTAVVAALCVVGVDALLQRWIPRLPARIEVADGVADLERHAPSLLVLGSSHARGFAEVARRVDAALPSHHTTLVAVERGKLSSYRWVLENRLLPLLDGSGPDGESRLPERVILVTEWWDSCAPETTPAQNIPGRAWTFEHFWSDFVTHGLRDYNRNYVNYHLGSWLRPSLLYSDRGIGRVPNVLLDALRGGAEARQAADRAARVEWWQTMVQKGFDDPRCYDDRELAAADWIIDALQSRGVEVRIVLYPRMPITITPEAERTTLARYHDLVTTRYGLRGVPVYDWSTRSPLGDEHFMSDFDHTTAEGNALLANWALAGDLRFLLHGEEAP